MRNLIFTIISAVALVAMVGLEMSFHSVAVAGVILSLFAFIPMKKVTMITVGVEAAREAVSNAVVAIYNESVSVPGFFRSFFPSSFSGTKKISFDVSRVGEKVAVDIVRGTGTRKNKVTRETLKTLVPPYFSEGSNINELDIYDVAMGTLDPSVLAQLSQEAAKELVENRKMIERAYELQCAQVLLTGIVTLKSGDNIDFKRKADSLKAIYNDWKTGTNDPLLSFKNGGRFVREQGKAVGNDFIAILGADAYAALTNNATFQKKMDIKQFDLGGINMPAKNSVGGNYVGTLTDGYYRYHLYTYGEVYEDKNGDLKNYMDAKSLVILPTNPNFKLAFAQVPMLGNSVTKISEVGDFWFKDYLDQVNDNHVQEIRSAGCPIPVAVDQIYTEIVSS